MESMDTEDSNKRLIDAELKIWRKVEDIAYAEGKHPDDVYADLMIEFRNLWKRNTPLRSAPMRKRQKITLRK